MFGELLLIAAVFLIAFAFYKWATLNNDFFEQRNIKFLKPSFFVGNVGSIFINKYSAAEFNQKLYQAYPNEPIMGFFDFRRPQYIARDPELIKQIAVKDFDHFEDHNAFADESVDQLWGSNLFLMKGEKWRHMRATLSPAFTGSKMRQMFQLVAECTDDVVKHFLTQAKTGKKINIEMKDFFSRYTSDVIATCAFGLKINSFTDPNNEFYDIGKNLMDFTSFLGILRILIVTQIPILARLFKIGFIKASVARMFKTTILETMKYREENNIYRPDMINIIMQVREGSLKQSNEKKEKEEGFATVEESEIGKSNITRSWSDTELVAQCFLFFLAGFGTSSDMLMFASYELAANLDIQEKLYQEITEMNTQLGGKRVTYDALQKMKYLDQVICETLRHWPPNVPVDRLCVKNYVLSISDELNLKMDKGTTVLFPIYGIHHDAKYFPDPERFDPERFNDENKGNIIPGTYIPFGVGPRNCIGSRFALMEIKSILYNLLLNFSFEPNEKTQIPIKLKKNAFNLIPENGLHLELKPRNM